MYSSTLFRVFPFFASRYCKDRITSPVSNSMEIPYGCQPDHNSFQPSPGLPRPPSAGEYYPHLGAQFPGPGYCSLPPQPQPYSQAEEYCAHQGSRHEIHQESHEIHQESHQPLQRTECETPSGLSLRPGGRPVLPRGQFVKVFCKADPNFSLAVREGSVVLVRGNASDNFQQWVRDDTYSTRVVDEDNCPSFSLINRATGQALKHGLGESHPVLLTEYQPGTFDESTLWTRSGDIGQGYTTIRLVNNIRLNLDAFRGDAKSGGIKDGNPVVLWSWNKKENQLWKIVPH